MDQLRLPRLLDVGDRVRVVAPAGPVEPTRLDRGLAWLRAAGLVVEEGQSLRRVTGHGLPFLAGDDDARRADLVDGLLDDDVRAVLAARGGNGTPRLLDDLPWGALRPVEPTIVAGLSDVTCLHQALAARLGWATLWSPMPAGAALAGRDPDGWSRHGLLDAVWADARTTATLAGRTLVDGEAVTAPLVGGTLALLSAMVGTAGFRPARGSIAILEDVGERPYRLERFLTHLRRGGFFDGVLGVAVGDLVACEPVDEVRAVVAEALEPLGVPVVTDLAFGHGARQASLWLGRHATLDPSTATLAQDRPA